MSAGERGGAPGADGDPNIGGLRRRQSSGTEDDELGSAADALGRNDPYTIGSPTESSERRRSIGGSSQTHQKRKSLSSGVDFISISPDREDDSRRPSRDSSIRDGARTVRFSSEVDRPTMRAGPTSRRPGDSGLSVRTSGDGGAQAGEGRSTDPQSGISPTSGSPISPKTRARGWSLRRAILNRTVDGSSEASSSTAAARDAARNSFVELQDLSVEAGPSSQRIQNDGPGHSAKDSRSKKQDATVTVSAVTDAYSEGPYSAVPDRLKLKQGLKGISSLPHYEIWSQKRTKYSLYLEKFDALLLKLSKIILRIKDIPPSKDGRHIPLDASRRDALIDERTGKPYTLNWIRSSRYSAWNFFPRQLWAQFTKLANFFFLTVAILQLIPGLSTTGNFTTIIPLMFFVAISMGKEGFDDLRRYRLDKVENNREAQVLHASQPVGSSEASHLSGPTGNNSVQWVSKKWETLQVGDIVKLERDDLVPADMIMLHSTGPNSISYIETMDLDGETNLKSKQAIPQLVEQCQTVEGIAACRAIIVAEDPNVDLYNFEGRVSVGSETIPLTSNEVVYRGSVLRNTSEAVGMVIFTGEECKIRMNANKNPRIKAPSLQFVVNRVVVVIVLFVIFLAVFCTAAYQVWKNSTEEDSWYLERANVAFFPILASFIIMFNTLIPLSLYVSLEIVKLAQMFLMNDVDMYDPVSNTPFEARTSTINEELGQISYIFSDKTGTLTDNSMKFRKISVAGTAWLHDADLIGLGKKTMLRHKKRKKGKGKAKKERKSHGDKPRKSSVSLFGRPSGVEPILDHDEDVESDREAGNRWRSSAKPANAQPEMKTDDLIRYMMLHSQKIFSRKARMFLLSLALCHTCLPEKTASGDINFQASSPDELALVKAAQELGFLCVDRTANTLTLKYSADAGDEDVPTETFQILDVIEFSSKRKRMSIVVRFPDGRVCILCKGADSIVMQRLRQARLANEKMVEIEKRAHQRKSMEAQIALRRKSESADRDGRLSLSRRSGSVNRPSIGALGRRRSSANPRRSLARDEVDHWLNERERDVEVSPVLDHSEFYTSRPSASLNRMSLALSEARSSMQVDEYDDLVDEALVLDEPAVIERTFQHINDFATEGLRTLLYGYRFIDEAQYAEWRGIYHDATTSLVDRQTKIEEAGELIERDLELAGATAIEDKLQVGVPEAIDKLRRANIKLWMLTGDKRETAINIGHSCRLIKDYSTVVVLDHEAGELDQHIAAALVNLKAGGIAHTVIVVDGQTLALIEQGKSLRDLFLDLAILADSVVCCRASPSQKATLVEAVRKRVKKSITLAIGDGANDIAMIQEAHVGIGIMGKEGSQAARTSDYSIAQFRFLTKLLLVHGRWNYIRTCKYTVGTFWKEFLFYILQVVYQRWNGYTGTSLFEPWSLSMFNTLFTSLPVIFLGVFEKDLAASTLLAVPELYTKGQRNGGFNFRIYVGWMFMAAVESMVVYFLMLGLFGEAVFTRDQTLFSMGDMAFMACVILISVKLQILEIHNRSYAAAIAVFCSVGGFFLWNMILSETYSSNHIYAVKDGFLYGFGRNPTWWLTLILILVICVVFELAVAAGRAGLFPTDVDVFRELEKDLEVRKRFEEASAMELQQGWDRGVKKSSAELEREEEEQKRREGYVQDILDSRPTQSYEEDSARVGSRGGTAWSAEARDGADGQEGPRRRSTEVGGARRDC